MWQIYHSVVLCILCAVFVFLFFNSVVAITVLILVLAGVIAFHDFPLKDFRFHVASLKSWISNLYHSVLNMYNQNSQMSDSRTFNDSNGIPSTNIGLFNRKNRSKANYNLYTVKNESPVSQAYNSPVTYSENSSLFSITKPFLQVSDTSKSYSHSDIFVSKSPKRYSRSPLITTTKNDTSKSSQMPVSPLVSSSRYNATLDPKLYADVSSPGFCGRVAQKLSEAKTHQTKYGAVGVFPVVNLNKSPKHYLSPHNSQAVAKSPVRVRIAPPDSSYTSGNRSVLLHQADGPMKSVLQVLKEISRKRIHSEINDDDETVKRIRTGDYHESTTPINTESTGQVKRAREDSQPNSGEEIKRRRHFRNNEIHSSLSSSIKVSPYNHGLKRKAYSDDGSRSSSPVLGKLLKVQTSSSPTFTTASLSSCTALPVPAPDDITKSTDSCDSECKEIKENVQPLPREVYNQSEEKKPAEVSEVQISSKSQNGSDNAIGGRRFMGRDVCLVNYGKAQVTEKPKREEKVVEEPRFNLVPPVNKQKRLTELLRAIDGYNEATVTAVVDEKPQQESKNSNSKAEESPGILLVPNNEKTVKSVSFSEPISVTKIISNTDDTPISSTSANSISGAVSDSQKELPRIPSVLKVENPFTEKQVSPLSTGFVTPQFSLQSNSPRQSASSLFSSSFTNKTSPVTVPSSETAGSSVQTVTSSTITSQTINSGIDNATGNKPGGFSFDLKVDKKDTEKSTDLVGSKHEAVGKPFTFGNTEEKNCVTKALVFGSKDTTSNIDNALGVNTQFGSNKNMTFGATETKKLESTEAKKIDYLPASSVSNFYNPVSSLASTSPPKFTFSSLSSSVINNALRSKSSSNNQTDRSEVLSEKLPTTKEPQLQRTLSSNSDVQKPNDSVVTTVVGNSSTDAVAKENKNVSISDSNVARTQSGQSKVNETSVFSSPVTTASHSTPQFNNTFGSSGKNIFNMTMDKKHPTDNKETFGNIFMNANKDSTQSFGNIFSKGSTSESNTLTKNIFGTITKEGQNKTDGTVSTFRNLNKDAQKKTESFGDGLVRNSLLQQKTEGPGSFSSDKPVTNGFTFTSASSTTATNSGIFSNVFNTSQLQTTANTTSTFTTPKFTSNFGGFTVQSTTAPSNTTPSFTFGSQSNTPSTGSVFGNVTTNAFTASNSGNVSNFSGLNQNNFSGTEGKPGFGATPLFTFGKGSTPTSNFAFGNKQPTAVSEAPVFGSTFKPTESKVFTFGGNSAPQAAGPDTAVFAFGQTAGPPAAQPVFQFNSGSNLSSQPSPGGFSFGSGTTPAVPAFQMGSNTTPKSMFSIGTGSTAPRSKSVARSRRLK